jgi:hypothetical protein
MATQTEIDTLRALVPSTELDDTELGLIIDASECLNQAAGKLWGQMAGGYAQLVNISEAGSSRSMGDLHKNALAMSSYYFGLGCPGVDPPPTTGRTQTRAIERL